jgi:hypothetical protein
MAHSKLSKVCDPSARTTLKALSYSFPQVSHCAMVMAPLIYIVYYPKQRLVLAIY